MREESDEVSDAELLLTLLRVKALKLPGIMTPALGALK